MFGGWGTEVSQKAGRVEPQWQEAVNCCLGTAALALKWVREQPRHSPHRLGGKRATTKIKDIEGITENCFVCLPLAVPFSFSVMCLMYIEGVSSSIISIICLVLLKWKHCISVLVIRCRRVSATLLKCSPSGTRNITIKFQLFLATVWEYLNRY